MGYLLLHGDMQNASFDDALYQGSHGDTDYYIVPTKRLPILMPFEAYHSVADPHRAGRALRAAIEGGYARDVNPGIATKVGLLPFRNPVQAIVNIIRRSRRVSTTRSPRPPATRPTGRSEPPR